jgi:hypothetical protein
MIPKNAFHCVEIIGWGIPNREIPARGIPAIHRSQILTNGPQMLGLHCAYLS